MMRRSANLFQYRKNIYNTFNTLRYKVWYIKNMMFLMRKQLKCGEYEVAVGYYMYIPSRMKKTTAFTDIIIGRLILWNVFDFSIRKETNRCFQKRSGDKSPEKRKTRNDSTCSYCRILLVGIHSNMWWVENKHLACDIQHIKANHLSNFADVSYLISESGINFVLSSDMFEILKHFLYFKFLLWEQNIRSKICEIYILFPANNGCKILGKQLLLVSFSEVLMKWNKLKLFFTYSQ